MFSLFAEVKFWTQKNDVQIRDTDFGTFRFQEKKDLSKSDVYALSKESYADGRGNSTVIRNRRPERLRSRLRELEHVLAAQKVAWCEWRPEGCLRVITTSGLIINIKTHLLTCALQAIRFDRFLVGKVAEITEVTCTRTHFIFSHAENQLTLVYFVKSPRSTGLPEKLQKLDPKVEVVELAGPAGRRLHRHVSANAPGDLVLTWWQTSRHEVYPWAPNVKDRDRANVHLYSLTATHLDLLAYFRTESDPVCVRFSQTRPHVLWAVEQKVSRKGDVTVESSVYHVVKRQLVKKTVTSIPLQTHVSCYAFSPEEDRIVFGCIDGSLVVLDEARGVVRQGRAAFIPTLLRWHGDGSLLLAANDRAQLQWFDLALSCVRAQLLSEDVTPCNLLDLGAYFELQHTLLKMEWSLKESVPFYGDKFAPNDNYLLLVFEGGPLAVLGLVGGGGLAGDIHSCGLTPDSLVRIYLTWNQVDKAISLLLSMDWGKQGAQCLAGLYHVTNAIFQAPLTPEREIQLETALGSFHSPIRPLPPAVYDEFADQVHDLTRRFFHQLVRHALYEKAFCLALDLNDRDLYLDLVSCARRIGDREMGQAVRQQLATMHSGGSSCSCDGSSEDDEECLPPLPSVKKPPLPEISRFSKLRESAFFSRTQPTFSMIPEEPAQLLTPDLPVDSSLPSVIEKLYDLPARPRLTDRPSPRILGATPSRNFLPEIGKFPLIPSMPSSIPFIPSPAAHFSSILGPSCSMSSSSPPSGFTPLPASTSSFLPSSSSGFTPLASSSMGFLPPPTTMPLIPPTTPFSFSSSSGLGGNLVGSPPKYPTNPLSSHLYGAASKASEHKAAAPLKQKVKFSDTVTQIVVPDISQLSGGKARRGAVKGVDPAQELADSLPLCLGNKDYLKDFAKAREEEEEIHGTTIKVIHFGVV